MKIAFTAKGENWDSILDPRFGRTHFIVLYDEETENLTSYDNRKIEGVEHGAGPQTANLLFDINPDVLITGNGPGGNASKVLEKAKVKIYLSASDITLQEAYELFKENSLKEF
ncbi:MAG: NifB/NifX family molybdenum-iron cluster-binding protein [Marinifilaceae bacterium]